MKKNNQILKIGLILSIIATIIAIMFIINKNDTVIDISTSILALVGSGIGLILSLLIKKVSDKNSKKKVFLSYNINDKEFALKIRNDLEDNSIIVYNENAIIKPGDTINKELEDYISHSDIMIVIVSKNTHKSKFLKMEIEIAKKNKKIIIPILKEEVDIPSFLNNYNAADFRIEYENSIKLLIDSL